MPTKLEFTAKCLVEAAQVKSNHLGRSRYRRFGGLPGLEVQRKWLSWQGSATSVMRWKNATCRPKFAIEKILSYINSVTARWNENPKTLHLEISSRCTLACPACPRTIFRGQFKVCDLPLQTIQRFGNGKTIYSTITLCGDHGDPIYHSEFHKVIEAFIGFPGEPSLVLETNGSHRSREWWKITASLLRAKDIVVFGVDGLEDTASIYRRNIDWASVVEAIATLKRYSRCAIAWQWILFRHNEHQLYQAREHCEKMGIQSFRIVQSFRGPIEGIEEPTITIEEAYERFNNPHLPAM